MNFTLAWTEQQLAEYKRSHVNLINKIFHCIGIPSIVLALMMMMYAVPQYGLVAVSVITGIVAVTLLTLDTKRGIGANIVLSLMFLLTVVSWQHRELFFWLLVAIQDAIVALILIFCICLFRSFRARELLGLLLSLLCCGGTMLVLYQFSSNSLLFAITLFVYGWIYQFVGHIFEGQPPAFTKNVWSLLIALLWIGELVIGYRWRGRVRL